MTPWTSLLEWRMISPITPSENVAEQSVQKELVDLETTSDSVESSAETTVQVSSTPIVAGRVVNFFGGGKRPREDFEKHGKKKRSCRPKQQSNSLHRAILRKARERGWGGNTGTDYFNFRIW